MSEDYDDRLEQEKLAAMKELAYGASHEINNPLANIAARAQTLLRDEQQPDRRLALESIHQQAMRAHEMISDLMLFARPPALNIQAFDLSDLLRTVVLHFDPLCEKRQTSLTLKLPESSAEISGDQQQLEVALRAVCTNALEAIGTNGAMTISLSVQKAPHMFVIDVADTGVGLTDEVRRHLFDPFYSGREAGRGLGFGMSKCWRIVTDHGGTISVSSQPGKGTAVSLTLPACAPQQAV